MREDAQKKVEMFSHLNQYDHNTLPTNMLRYLPPQQNNIVRYGLEIVMQ